jgi:hypothetical protein
MQDPSLRRQSYPYIVLCVLILFSFCFCVWVESISTKVLDLSNKMLQKDLLHVLCFTWYNRTMPLDNQVNIRVDDDLLYKIKLLAKQRYSTPSQIVRQAVAEYLEKKTVKVTS